MCNDIVTYVNCDIIMDHDITVGIYQTFTMHPDVTRIVFYYVLQHPLHYTCWQYRNIINAGWTPEHNLTQIWDDLHIIFQWEDGREFIQNNSSHLQNIIWKDVYFTPYPLMKITTFN